MRQILTVILLYILFLLQASLAPHSPDFLLLVIIVVALHEPKAVVTLLALFSGICLDLLHPTTLGTNIVVHVTLGYGIASLRGLFYRSRWYILLLAVVGLLLRHGAGVLVRSGPPALTAIGVSAGLSLVLALPVELLLSRTLYRRWQHA